MLMPPREIFSSRIYVLGAPQHSVVPDWLVLR